MATVEHLCEGPQGIIVTRSGRVTAVVSPGQLRLLRALGQLGTVAPTEQAIHAVWPDATDELTASQQKSAIRSITTLCRHGWAERRNGGVSITQNGLLLRIMIDIERLGRSRAGAERRA